MNTINTDYGTLTLTNEMITVDDKPYRKSMRMILVISLLGSLTATAFLIKQPDDFSRVEFWLWAVIFMGNLLPGLFFLRLTYQEAVMVDEIKSIKYRAPLGNGYLSIRLKNGRIRRVAGLKPRDARIKAYLAANFPA
ncbi:MAG: hypothetical protein AAF597_01225 [Bacteroidota bacterium]